MKNTIKTLFWLTFAIVAGAAVYRLAHYETANETKEVAKKEEIISKDEQRLRDYMDSPEYRKEMEIRAKTDLLLSDKKYEINRNAAQLSKLEADYKAAVAEENAKSKASVGEIEAKLDGLRKEELNLASSTKSSLE